MFQSWTLKQKLIASYFGVMMLFAAVMTMAIVNMGKISSLAKDMYVESLQPIAWVAKANVEAVEQDRGLYDFVIEKDPKEFANIEKEILSHKQKQMDLLKKYTDMGLNEKERQLIQKFNLLWADYEKHADHVRELARSGKTDEALKYLNGPSTESFELASNGIEDLVILNEKQGEEAFEETKTISAQTDQRTFLSMSAIFLVVMSFGWWFSNIVSRQIRNVSSKLSEGAGTVADASTQITSAGVQLSSATTQQAAALQETAASVDQISAMVSKNADGAQRSQEISRSSQQSTAEGKNAVSLMVQAIEEISRSNDEIVHQIEQSNSEISEIVKLINEIGSKTKVINDIVFQTKLLSFNASVEAARAGEHGKGFAVVAEEVGGLAAMSGNAAKEITSMLADSIQKVENIVEQSKDKVNRLIEIGKDKVELGTKTARQCGEILDKIVSNVEQVNVAISEIATASQEQSRGIEEITKAMAQLDQGTQQNASAAQESAGASESLNRQTVELREMVDTLMSIVDGKKAA